MSAAAPKPFSITLAPARAKASAIARPMPLVEPVTTADWPASCLSFIFSSLREAFFSLSSGHLASLVRNHGRGAQHFHVGNAVLVVGRRYRVEAQRAVEA